jgi:hypothetical protein
LDATEPHRTVHDETVALGDDGEADVATPADVIEVSLDRPMAKQVRKTSASWREEWSMVDFMGPHPLIICHCQPLGRRGISFYESAATSSITGI